MSFDARLQGVAQRYYVMAVQMAKAAGSDMLAAVALAALARQLFDLLEPDDGLEVVALAQYGTRRTATPGLWALLHTREAWAHALQGCTNAVHKAVGLAEEAYAQREPDTEPRWTSGLDAAELAGVIGARYRDLARYDPAQASRAVRYIGQALVLRDASRQRNRVFDLIGLARVHLITGAPEQAAARIGQAMLSDRAEVRFARAPAAQRGCRGDAGGRACQPQSAYLQQGRSGRTRHSGRDRDTAHRATSSADQRHQPRHCRQRCRGRPDAAAGPRHVTLSAAKDLCRPVAAG
jgi:hypothetical protein